MFEINNKFFFIKKRFLENEHLKKKELQKESDPAPLVKRTVYAHFASQ